MEIGHPVGMKCRKLTTKIQIRLSPSDLYVDIPYLSSSSSSSFSLHLHLTYQRSRRPRTEIEEMLLI